ncbi:FAD-dependent thymidylate synthase [Candidatus Similichlamydia epinepheli]|uniref:FAD-dependent thymidylate synthase n=1 Tax=Candidatus Similichlamydia epinepheli TaxID=1903953 RepID=UPI000D39BA94|nr:FAD-dependent thymidylate synthase [Candidatus Similichlamydia epinepheli]
MSKDSNRPRSSSADKMVGVPMQTLSGEGHVTLVDYIGSDASVVRGARCSYGESNKTFQEDERLIRFLMRHAHTSPFEQVSFVFRLRLPLFLSFEFTRCRPSKYQIIWPHEDIDFWIPDSIERSSIEPCYNQIKQLLYSARNADKDSNIYFSILPGTVFIELIWQIDLHNMLYFIQRRREINLPELKEYIDCILLALKSVAPCCYSAFTDYVLEGKLLKEADVRSLADQIKSLDGDLIMQEAKKVGMSQGETQEFLTKIKRFTSNA